jgi:hypothetical protein
MDWPIATSASRNPIQNICSPATNSELIMCLRDCGLASRKIVVGLRKLDGAERSYIDRSADYENAESACSSEVGGKARSIYNVSKRCAL